MYQAINPSTGEIHASFQHASHSQITLQIEKLSQGFEKWAWLDPQHRAKILTLGLRELEKNKEKMVAEITNSMGKPKSQSIAEFDKSLHAAKYLCELDHSFLNSELKIFLDSTHTISKVPLGVIFGIMPWNFPLWQTIRMMIPTLISGNAILLKHSDLTAGVGDLIAECFSEKVLGYSIFSHLLTSHEDSEKIISDPRIGGVSLTGSIRAGKVVGELCGRHLKKVVLELGGSDPSLVFADCDLEKTVKSVMRSRFLNAGQVCIATKRVFVEKRILNSFLDAAKKNFSELIPQRAHVSDCRLGPLSHFKFATEFENQMKMIAAESEVVAQNFVSNDLARPQTAFVAPKILLFKKQSEFFKTGEIFGPALCVIPFDDEDSALTMANATIFGLGASLYTKDQKRIQRLSSKMIAGQVTINGFVTSDVRLPFGGFRQSGLGRELGVEGFLEFTSTKVVTH